MKINYLTDGVTPLFRDSKIIEFCESMLNPCETLKDIAEINISQCQVLDTFRFLLKTKYKHLQRETEFYIDGTRIFFDENMRSSQPALQQMNDWFVDVLMSLAE